MIPVKMFSKILNEPFYLSEETEEPIDGLPCFSRKEIALLKKVKLSTDELRVVFESKKIGMSLESLVKEEAVTQVDVTKPYSSEYAKQKRMEITSKYLKDIIKTISETKVKGE